MPTTPLQRAQSSGHLGLSEEDLLLASRVLDQIEAGATAGPMRWKDFEKSLAAAVPTLRAALGVTSVTIPIASVGDWHLPAGVYSAIPATLLKVVRELGEIAGERSQSAREALLRELTATVPETVSPASLNQAKQEAAHRQRLLRTPTYSYEDLRLLRGDPSVQATRMAVSRMRKRHELFTVPAANNRVTIPAFQLNDEGMPRPELAPLLEPLMAVGLGPWQLWTWLTSPTGLLSGGVPADLAAESATAERAATAARRFAARIAPRPQAASV